MSHSHNHTTVIQSHNLTISQSHTLNFTKWLHIFKFDDLLTNNVDTRDPIGSNNYQSTT